MMYIHYLDCCEYVQLPKLTMPKPEELKEIANECPGFQARATARAITRFFNMYFRPLDMTSEQFSLLIGIEAALGITVADLAAKSGVDATTLSRNVQILEKRKLVRGVGRGRAGKRLELTSTGRQPPGESNPVVAGGQDEIGHCFGGERTAIGQPHDARRGRRGSLEGIARSEQRVYVRSFRGNTARSEPSAARGRSWCRIMDAQLHIGEFRDSVSVLSHRPE